jgi:glycerol-3-phosphate dehydrogenase (NAD(P)+)
MKIGILGCGNWGSVFGIIQARNGHTVRIWEFDKPRAQRVKRTRDNRPFLSQCKLPEEIGIYWEIEPVLKSADLVVFALPSQVVRKVTSDIRALRTGLGSSLVLSLIKGIDIQTLQRPSEIISKLPVRRDRMFVLSGPSIANEIIRGEPTAVVLVGRNARRARSLQGQLATRSFRIYEGRDLVGVELGGALKNVLALACGISDGLGLGANTKGALISRGIKEIQRLGVRMGARALTFLGLSGIGDLITTSFSRESRNHAYGTLIGQCLSRAKIERDMVMVAEGVPTARAVHKLAARHGVEMPICSVVYDILYRNKPPQQGIKDLMTRPLRKEG